MTNRRKSARPIRKFRSNQPEPSQGKLRIIGGKYRGRQIEYSGDPRTRPMKDNIREALFNLVGGWMKDKHVFDLFAGTGAIGIEALSRGAAQATLIERHVPSVKIIRDNLNFLDATEVAQVVSSDTFFWARQFFREANFPTQPWAVFFSPPYDFYVDRQDEMIELIDQFRRHAPEQSLLAVESDHRFSAELLPSQDDWRVRSYSPAQIAILRENSD